MFKNRPTTNINLGVLYVYSSLLAALFFGLASSSLTARWMTESDLGHYRFVISSVSVASSAMTFGLFSSAGTLLAGKGSSRFRRLVARGAGVHAWIVAAACSICVGLVLYSGKGLDGWGTIMLAALLGGAMSWSALLQEMLRAGGLFSGIAVLNAAPSGLFILLLSASHLVGRPLDASLVAVFFFFSQGLISSGLATRYGMDLKPDKTGFAYLIKRNRSLGLNVYWATFLGALTAQAGIFVLQGMRSPVDVAEFALAMTLTAPLTLLPSSIGTAYFSRLPGAPGFPRRVIGFGWAASAVVALMFCLSVPYAVDFLYGSKFSAVSTPAQLCGVAAILHGMGDVYNRYYLANRDTGLLLRVVSIVCAIAIISSAPAAYFYGPQGASFARLASSGAYALIMVYCYHIECRRFGS